MQHSSVPEMSPIECFWVPMLHTLDEFRRTLSRLPECSDTHTTHSMALQSQQSRCSPTWESPQAAENHRIRSSSHSCPAALLKPHLPPSDSADSPISRFGTSLPLDIPLGRVPLCKRTVPQSGMPLRWLSGTVDEADDESEDDLEDDGFASGANVSISSELLVTPCTVDALSSRQADPASRGSDPAGSASVDTKASSQQPSSGDFSDNHIDPDLVFALDLHERASASKRPYVLHDLPMLAGRGW